MQVQIEPRPAFTTLAVTTINGVAINRAEEELAMEELRQRACTELLRQAAQCEGLLDKSDAPTEEGMIGEAALTAIDSLLERAIDIPDPTDEACRRDYAAREQHYRQGQRAKLRHILFAVTEGVDVVALRKRAESALLEARCEAGKSDNGTPDAFSRMAAELSNCPSGRFGGALGWVTAEECAPEIAMAVFGNATVGVLPQLVHSRFGLHVVEVQARERGELQPFEAVHGAVSASLRQRAFAVAVRHYIQQLAARALIKGMELGLAGTELMQ
ncbi:MAG TPA: peptidylprolyl isomerase [Burkholderiaceae bacterium]